MEIDVSSRGAHWFSIQVEESHNFSEVSGLLTCFRQQLAVMEGKANDLLYTSNDVKVTQPAVSPRQEQ